MKLPLILASASPARLQLLHQSGIKPDFAIALLKSATTPIGIEQGLSFASVTSPGLKTTTLRLGQAC